MQVGDSGAGGLYLCSCGNHGQQPAQIVVQLVGCNPIVYYSETCLNDHLIKLLAVLDRWSYMQVLNVKGSSRTTGSGHNREVVALLTDTAAGGH